MKMQVCDVIQKIEDIDEAIKSIDRIDNADVIDLLIEYRDKILLTEVNI